jgi:hypothetical protein
MTILTCERCPEKCPKICNATLIREYKVSHSKPTKEASENPFFEPGGVSQLEKFGTGCTIIEGDLDINIVEDVANLTTELKTYLGDVEEIRGVIKIHRFLSRIQVFQIRVN